MRTYNDTRDHTLDHTFSRLAHQIHIPTMILRTQSAADSAMSMTTQIQATYHIRIITRFADPRASLSCGAAARVMALARPVC